MWQRFGRRMSTPAIRTLARHAENGQTVTLHRVQVSSQKTLVRRALVAGAVVFACGYVYVKIVLVPLGKSVAKLAEDLPEVDEKDDSVEGIFMPFPLTTKKIKPPPYAGHDPEWQAFVKHSKDSEANRAMRNDLAELVRSEVGRSPLAQKLGTPIKVRRWWLDADYPDAPPPEYRRSGLLLDHLGLKWTEMPVDQMTAMRLERVLWPSALGWSAFAFAVALLQQTARDVQRYLGLQPSQPGSPSASGGAPGGGATALSSAAASTDMQKALQRVRQRTTRKTEEVKDPSALGSSQSVDGEGAAPRPAANHVPSRPGDTDKQAQGVVRTEAKGLFPGPAQTMSMAGPGPWEAFRKTFARHWRPVIPHPPKGCVIVTGLVELEAPRGYVTIDVLAGFDPTAKVYDRDSMHLKVRRIQARNQSPRR